MSDEELKALVDAFRQKLALDPEIRAAEKKIADGTADFSDTSRLFWRRSVMLREYTQDTVRDLAPEDRQRLVEALLHRGYDDTTEALTIVQEALDEAQGLHLNPVVPKYPAERVVQVAHALMDPTVPDEKIVRRAGAPVANVQMSFHDRYIEENARIRAKLGMKPTITRYGSGCCKWCSEVAGRYRFGEQPDGIFRRHDNCDCVIIYDNQVLRGHRNEDGGTSRAWEKVDPAEVEKLGFTPTVHTQEQAKKLQENALDGLTKPGQGDIMRVADSGSIYHEITDENIQKVPLLDMFGDDEKNKRYQEANKALLREAQKHKPGVEVTTVYDADMKPIEGFEYRVGIVGGSTISNPGVPFHGFHNHGSDETFSLTDLMGFASANDMLSVTATGNRGSIYLVKRTKSSDSDGYKQFLSDKYTEPFCKIKDTDITIKMTKDESTWGAFYKGLTDSEKEHFMDELTRFGKECAEGGEKYGFKYEYHKA